MAIDIGPGKIVFILGFFGLLFSLAQKTGESNSKIVLAVFFIIVIGVGVWLEYLSGKREYDVFGEFEGNRIHR